MLRFAEEILVLALDEARGEIAPDLPVHGLNLILAGAVLADLALENRIDTDPDRLVVIDRTPTADDLLDPTLREIAQETRVRDTGFWVAQVARRGEETRDRALTRLIERGILESEGGGLLFLSRPVSRSRRYATHDGKVVEEARLRIMRVLFSDDIPEPRDIVIVCLADACGVFERILSRAELDQVRERIGLLRRMDLIGRSITEAIRRIEPSEPPLPRAREIPHAPGLPVAGNAIGMARDLPAFLVEQYRQLGPVFRIRAFNRRYIVLAGPEANLFVARGKSHFRSHETWLDFISALGASRLLVGLDGTEHVRMRRAHANAYSRKLVDGRVGEAFQIARRETERWPQDKPIKALHAFQRLVTEQLGIMATGVSPREYVDDLIFYFDTLISTHVSRDRPRAMMWRPRFRRARRRVRELARTVLEGHGPERRPPAPPDFVDELMDLRRADPHLVPEADWPALVLGPFVAGLDTAAGICAFMLYELLKHPEILRQMTAEANDLFDRASRTDETIGLQELRGLDVTRRVAMEAMRKYPLSPVLARTVANSFEFEGYRIPAGAEILLGFTLAHHMPEWFPDPERFDIERYTPERSEHRQPGAYAPLGVGVHQCLGRSLAEVLIAINMTTVVRNAELVLDPPDYELKTKRSPHLLPHDSLKFRVVNRREGS